MLGVMIVDDEYIVREDIKNLIDWEAQECRIVAEASNGEDGFRQFERYHPDIVFSDIKMPVADGFEMIRRITGAETPCEIILLTGYDDFEYARQAMQYNLNTYILKHELTAESLLEILKKAKESLSNKRQNVQVIRGNMFREILMGRLTEQSLSSMEQEGILHVRGGSVGLTLFENRENSLTVEEVSSICSGIPSLRCYSVVDDNAYRVAIVKISAYGLQAQKECFDRLAAKAEDYLRRVEKLPANLLFYGNLNDLIGLKDTYVDAKAAMRYFAFSRGPFGALFFPGLQVEPMEKAFMHRFAEDIFLTLSRRDYVGAIECAEAVYGRCAAAKDLAGLAFLKAETLSALERHCAEIHLRPAQRLALFQNTQNIFEALSLLKRLLLDLDTEVSEQEGGKMYKVMQYIKDAYQSDITLRDIARILDINEIYAGQLFKKKTGMTFKSYLTQVRINKAKELLKSGNYKIYEVSGLVGYQTTQYFCSKFKKVTGKNPSDYL